MMAFSAGSRVALVVRMTVAPCAEPGPQKPQKEVMGKMIDGESSLVESVGAAGVVIWK